MPSTPLCDAMRLIVSSISACERCGRGAGAAEGAQRRASGVSGGGGGGGSGGEAGGGGTATVRRVALRRRYRNQNQFVAHEELLVLSAAPTLHAPFSQPERKLGCALRGLRRRRPRRARR